MKVAQIVGIKSNRQYVLLRDKDDRFYYLTRLQLCNSLLFKNNIIKLDGNYNFWGDRNSSLFTDPMIFDNTESAFIPKGRKVSSNIIQQIVKEMVYGN